MATPKDKAPVSRSEITLICPFCDGLGVYAFRDGSKDTCAECAGEGFTRSYESTHMKLTWQQVLERYPFLDTDE